MAIVALMGTHLGQPHGFVRESHIGPFAHVLWSGFSLPPGRVRNVDA
jgi:hypothetical protein